MMPNDLSHEIILVEEALTMAYDPPSEAHSALKAILEAANKPDADNLLAQVHERLGLGIDLRTFADGTVEARWKRDYDGEWSDERFLSVSSIEEALRGILEYEDQADAEDAQFLDDV